MIITGRKISGGSAQGETLVTCQGISFFGGVDPETGVVVERDHELEGKSIAGRVLVFPTGKGSTVGSYTIYRLKHSGAAPLAMINTSCETITAVGCIIAEIPCVDQIDLSVIQQGMWVRVNGDAGTVELCHHLQPTSLANLSYQPDHSPPDGNRIVLPAPLGGWDFPSFAYHTITNRLPKIAQETLTGLQEENDGKVPPEVAEALYLLSAGMPCETIRFLQDKDAPDTELWQEYISPYLGKTWLELPWFFAEMYFYRRILEATGYYRPGWGERRDPFTISKRKGVTSSLEGIHKLSTMVTGEDSNDPTVEHSIIQRLLLASLWGNQADLSMWAAGDGPGGMKARKTKDSLDNRGGLIVDHSGRASQLLAAGLERIDIVLDNNGPELMADLALVDYLLSHNFVQRIFLHTKAHPTFVSDVTAPDISLAVRFLKYSEFLILHNLGERLEQELLTRRLHITPDKDGDNFFWHSPTPFWDRPGSLGEELAQSDLLVFKGDANFRRLLGDRHWPHTTAFETILNLRPHPKTPVLALRVCKSEVVCGLQEGQSEDLFTLDPKWMTDGEWGMAMLADDSINPVD